MNPIVTAIETRSGKSLFLHEPGGTEKIYVYNTLCYFSRDQRKFILCVASSGIAILLLIGSSTFHFTFKFLIKIYKSSLCAIPRNFNQAELIYIIHLVIWDKALLQYCHVYEAVDRSFRNIRICEDKVFRGLIVVFRGDFKQILPVIVKDSQPRIIGACLQKSQ